MQQLNGISYKVPLISNVTGVFALPDGLLLEVEYRHQPTFESIKSTVLGTKMETEEETYFSYFTLSFHPLQDFRPLKISREYCFLNRNVC